MITLSVFCKIVLGILIGFLYFFLRRIARNLRNNPPEMPRMSRIRGMYSMGDHDRHHDFDH